MKRRSTDIFSDFERIRERMEQAWQQMLGPPGAPRFCAPLIEPPVDVYETDDEVFVLVELAGIAEQDVEIVVDGKLLVLRGERNPGPGRPGRQYSQMEIAHGPFRREIVLPADVNADEARATYADGMLEIVLPKVARRVNRHIRVVVHSRN